MRDNATATLNAEKIKRTEALCTHSAGTVIRAKLPSIPKVLVSPYTPVFGQVDAREGVVPDPHERGSFRQVEALGLAIGLALESEDANATDRRGDHERARKVSGMEGVVPDLHERGRLRQVEAREFGVREGGGANPRDRGGDL